MQLGTRGEAADKLFTLPRTQQAIAFVPRERAFPWLSKRSAAVSPRGRADERYIDVSYEPFFIDLAQRMELNLIGGDAPQVDPDRMPGVSPRMGVRAQTLIGCVGLRYGVPMSLELWQSDTERAISRTRIRTDLVFRAHNDAELPHTLLLLAGVAGREIRSTLEPSFESEQRIVLPGFLAGAMTLTTEATTDTGADSTASAAGVSTAGASTAGVSTAGVSAAGASAAGVSAARVLWDDEVLAELAELAPQPEPAIVIETFGQDLYVSMPAIPLRTAAELNRFLAVAERVTQAVHALT